jgi:hypothetical protein
MREIQRQLSGVKLAEAEKPLKCSKEVPTPQKRLMESLLTLPRPTIEEEMVRRTEAIDAVAAYSLFEEGDTCRLPRDKRSPRGCVAVVPVHEDESMQDAKMTETNSLADDPLQAAIRSVIRDRSSMRQEEYSANKKPAFGKLTFSYDLEITCPVVLFSHFCLLGRNCLVVN